MYGRTGKLVAKTGSRPELVTILTKAADVVGEMPGCHLYLVNEDLTDENIIWVMEVWGDKEAHATSLQNEQVRALIQEAMPLIDGAPEGTEMNVVGGHGLKG